MSIALSWLAASTRFTATMPATLRSSSLFWCGLRVFLRGRRRPRSRPVLSRAWLAWLA